jgi:hypothetical protein
MIGIGPIQFWTEKENGAEIIPLNSGGLHAFVAVVDYESDALYRH